MTFSFLKLVFVPLNHPPAYLRSRLLLWSPSVYLTLYPLPFKGVDVGSPLSDQIKHLGFSALFPNLGSSPACPLRSHNSLEPPRQSPPHPPLTGGLHVTRGAEAPVRVAKSGRGSGLLAKPAGSCRPQAWGSGTRCLTGCSKGCPGKGMRGRAGSRM